MKFSDQDIVAWLSGDLEPEQGAKIEQWIETSEEARRRVAEFRQLDRIISSVSEYEAPPAMLAGFRKRIAGERHGGRDFTWYRLAASVILLIAMFAGGRMSVSNRTSDPALADLQAEIQTLQKMVLINTLSQHTPSERLQAISLVERSGQPQDDDLVQTLMHSMSYDESPTVRAASVQALARHLNREDVRMTLVHSLGEETDPLVQIAVIRLLMDAQETSAVAPLMQLADDANFPEEVRRTAEMALKVLI